MEQSFSEKVMTFALKSVDCDDRSSVCGVCMTLKEMDMLRSSTQILKALNHNHLLYDVGIEAFH